MADQTPLQAVSINMKASLQDLAVVKMVSQTGEMCIYPARNYIYTTCEPQDEFFANLAQFENILPSGDSGVQYGIAAVIDISKYYAGICPLRVIAVQSLFDTSRVSVQITESGRKMLYFFNSFTPVWQSPGETDFFFYTVMNTDTGETGSAQVSLSRFTYFVPNDIYIELNPFYSGIVRIDLRKFIDNGYTIAATGIGAFNTQLIYGIAIDAQNPHYIQVNLVTCCANWGCNWTDFEVFLQLTDPDTKEQQTSKVYINLIKACETFLANPIEIDINGDVPSFIEIDIARFNEHAFIELLQVGDVDAEKGSAVVNSPFNFVKYYFNRSNNYWNRNMVQDMFEYNIRNRANGKTAKSYILIRKTSGGSSSSGSGSNLQYDVTYNISSKSTLIKQDPLLGQTGILYSGTIVTSDNAGNQISLPATLFINPSDGSFTGTVGDSQVYGTITFVNENITNDPIGTPLTNTGGGFQLN